MLNPLGGPLVVKLRGEESGGSMTAFESAPAPGEGPPLHTHANEDEAIYFLEGHFRVKLEGAVHDAPAGSFMFIQKGTPHSWQNIGDTPGRLFVIFTPAAPGMERFFAEFSEVDPNAAAEGFATLGPEAGMKLVGPPMAQSDPQ